MGFAIRTSDPFGDRKSPIAGVIQAPLGMLKTSSKACIVIFISKAPQAWWLKTIGISSHSSEGQSQRCQQGRAPSETLDRRILPRFFLDSGGVCQSLAFLGL